MSFVFELYDVFSPLFHFLSTRSVPFCFPGALHLLKSYPPGYPRARWHESPAWPGLLSQRLSYVRQERWVHPEQPLLPSEAFPRIADGLWTP